MKRFCLFSFLLFATLVLQAQRPYFCVTEGTVMEYANYGNEEKTSGYTRITVKNVEGSDGNYAITYQTTIFDSDRQPLLDPADMTVSIDNGNVSASLGTVGIVEMTTEARVFGRRSTSTTRNWYARGVGSIKSETLDENGNITGSQILVKLED
ncbi:MAG: hypothetical protein WC395_07570 [Bacteroidales bacterium]|jgi:hypothetical protein